ncbi:MAG: hypothetical protein ACXW2I_19155 [Burkholderiales bacterium]
MKRTAGCAAASWARSEPMRPEPTTASPMDFDSMMASLPVRTGFPATPRLDLPADVLCV